MHTRRLLMLLALMTGCSRTAARGSATPEPAVALTDAPVAAPTAIEDATDTVSGGKRDRVWWRMLAGNGALLTVMEVKYWMDKEVNQFDFEYEADWRNVRERFGTLEAWRFDDNFFNTNGWRHTAQGGMGYLFARSNGFTSLESYVVSLAQSGAWEIIGEYKEEISVNDLVMTPRSGFVVGEASWQLGVFLLRSESTWVNEVLGNVFTFGAGVNNRWDGKRRKRADAFDPLGLDATVDHRFTVTALGGVQSLSDSDEREAIVRTQLATDLRMIPYFRRPGRFSRIYTAPAFTEASVSWTAAERAVVDFTAYARAAVTTWHKKDISTETGRGYNLLLGLASAYEYSFHRAPSYDTDRTRDRLGIVNIVGPSADLSLYHGRLVIRAVLDIYGDMAVVRNHAIDAYRAANPGATVRSTIDRDNYHHAYGVTAMSRLELGYRGLRVAVAAQHDRLRSIQGLDRHQEDIVDDYPLDDARTVGSLSATYRLAVRALGIELGGAVESRDRSGQVKDVSQSSQERRALIGATFAF
jgi:hypothetical protein